MLLPMLCWMHPYKKSGNEKDVAAGTDPAHHMDIVPGRDEVPLWVNRDAAAEVSGCGCHAGCRQSHAVRLQRKRPWMQRSSTSLYGASPVIQRELHHADHTISSWPQLELSKMSGHEGKPTGKAGPVLTQELFPKRPHASLLPTNVIVHVNDFKI